MIRRINVTILALILCAATLMLTACGNGPVGFWQVEQITAGDVVMTKDDAQSLGLATVGSVKLQKSGNCEVVLIGEESTGTWQQAEDGTITVDCGETLVLTGSIQDDGYMVLTDAQGSEYRLKK